MKKINFWIGLIFLIFGLLTVVSGGRSLFTDAGLNARGNIVPLILWLNFISGFFYILASYFTFSLKTCVKRLSIGLAVLNTLAFIYFLSHILQGGLFEKRTLIAMSFRTVFWVTFAIYFQKSPLFQKMNARF